MDKRQANEIHHFKRIMMSLTDIRYTADLIKEYQSNSPAGVAKRAVEESIIISYSRPFSGNDSGNLRTGFLSEFTETQKKVHERVSKNLRNRVVAHSDSKAYGVTFSVFETGEVKWVLPRQRRIPSLLEPTDISVILQNCEIIESWLFKEQSRVKEYLPVGVY